MAFTTTNVTKKLPAPRFAKPPVIMANTPKVKYHLKLKRGKRGTSKPGFAGTAPAGTVVAD